MTEHLEIRRTYVDGRGGRHRDTVDALRWRQLTTQIANTMREIYPRMQFVARQVHAELEAVAVTHAQNARALRAMNII